MSHRLFWFRLCRVRIALVLILLCPISTGCAPTVPKITTTAEFAGKIVKTTVDSHIAKYYLENYLQNKKTNPDFDQLIDEIHDAPQHAIPSREQLKVLSDRMSVDFAALYLANYLLKADNNQPVQQNFNQELTRIKPHWESVFSPNQRDYSSYLFLFVPGWFYRSEPWTGADLARPRKVVDRLGFANHLVEVDELGTIEDNARRIAKYIIQYQQSGKKIILVSVSKAGAEVALALGQLLEHQQTQNVKAWVNIGGLLQGSFIADSATRWPKRWMAKPYFIYMGWDFASVESMTTRKSKTRFARLSIPRHILIINYIGIPLSGDVSVLAHDRYQKLRHHGPNDGLTLITDAIVPRGFTIVQLGFDHFFLDPAIDIKSAALIHTLLHYIESH